MSALDPVVVPNAGSGPRVVTGAPTARGFVLYVALDEAAVAAAGTTFSKLAQDVRAYVESLVPAAESHATVALAPADAPGSNIDVVRAALGDPTVARLARPAAGPAPSQAQPARPTQAQPAAPAGVLIDLSRREVHLDGEMLNLTFKEFEILNYLVENSTRPVGRNEFLSKLWPNTDDAPNERTIDVHIGRLRMKLGRLADTVRGVHGQGYRFYDHPEAAIRPTPEHSI